MLNFSAGEQATRLQTHSIYGKIRSTMSILVMKIKLLDWLTILIKVTTVQYIYQNNHMRMFHQIQIIQIIRCKLCFISHDIFASSLCFSPQCDALMQLEHILKSPSSFKLSERIQRVVSEQCNLPAISILSLFLVHSNTHTHTYKAEKSYRLKDIYKGNVLDKRETNT